MKVKASGLKGPALVELCEKKINQLSNELYKLR